MPFAYTFRADDLETIANQDKDLLENRDRELELYLNQPQLKLSENSQQINTGATADITWVNELVDSDDMITVSSATITVRQTGLYALSVSILGHHIGDITMYLMVDGIEQTNFTATRSLVNGYDPSFLSANLYLVANQGLKIRVKNVNITPWTNVTCTLAMTRLMA